MTRASLILLACLAWPSMAEAAGHGSTGTYDVAGKDVTTLLADLSARRVTSAELVRLYAARIGALDHAGPSIHAVLAVSPTALAEAQASDARRQAGDPPRALEGIPILVKDNIEVADGLPTTAGSLALAANIPHRDAPLVKRLRDAGAVILGKTNLSEWANFRSKDSTSGWSGVGGLTRNPYATDRSACGSSSGSGAAVAASFAAAAIGTETDGSITCPASMTGLVGLKPTVGLVSRHGVVPISSTQDTAGPMTRTVADAALVLAAIAGTDPADAATADADGHRPDATLPPGALRGARIGVARFLAGHQTGADALFERALARLRDAGATLVELTQGPDLDAIGKAEFTVLLCEFKTDLDAYLATTPDAVATRTLAGVIAFNRLHADRELALFGQDIAEKAEATAGKDDPAYAPARDLARDEAGARGLGPIFATGRLDAIVAPSTAPAYVIDVVNGDRDIPAASTLPAVLGWPHLTVPMGTVDGLPVGISFIGLPWSEARLLALGADFERVAGPVPPPGFEPAPASLLARRGALLPVLSARAD